MTPKAAYVQVRRAIEAGRLVRPSNCTKCGKADQKAVAGRHTIQAHHHVGYDKPLDVEWLCPKCHRIETPLPKVMGGKALGVRNGAARLTPDMVRYIRASPKGCTNLSREIGVAKCTVLRVRRGVLWSHVA